MTFANPTLSNGHGPTSPQPWLKESVRAFFEGFAWTDHAMPSTISGETSASGEAPGSMMTMTVHQFFETMAWDGQPTIGVPIAPVEAQPDPPPTEDSLTLDGFSDLFG